MPNLPEFLIKMAASWVGAQCDLRRPRRIHGRLPQRRGARRPRLAGRAVAGTQSFLDKARLLPYFLRVQRVPGNAREEGGPNG